MSAASAHSVLDFSGTVVVVTGAARGQGLAEAAAFARLGATVYAADIDAEALESATSPADGTILPHPLDVTSETAWIELAGEIGRAHGRLDVLVNNAGVPLRRTLTETTDAEFARVLDVNVRGAFLGIRSFAALLRAAPAGAVVNIGSSAGMTGGFAAAYSTSKWALRGLTKAAAIELAPRVRVNAVHPGIVATEFTASDHSLVESMASRSLRGRPASPDEIADMVLVLCSPLARNMTGQDVVVDGGFVDCAAYLGVARDIGAVDRVAFD